MELEQIVWNGLWAIRSSFETLCNLDFNMNHYCWKLELHDNVQFRKTTKLNFNKICKAINGTGAEVHSYTYLCELGFTVDQYDCN
jgi:hypothetical protein